MKFFITILISFFMIACKSGNDQFAAYSGGSITRAEFNDWLESRNIPVDLVCKDKYAVNDYLRQIAVEKLTSEMAEKSLFNQEKLYILIEKTLYKNLLSTFYTLRINENVSFMENAVDISIIRLFFNTGDKTPESVKQNKINLIRQILSELKAGTDFSHLAGKYSEDSASSKNGHLGIIPESLLEREIAEPLSLLKENEYITEPVILKDSVFLVKLHSRHIITEKNIRSIVSDKKNVDKILNYYKSKTLDVLFEKMVSDKNIISNISKVFFINKKEVIFSIAGDNFTTEELDEILNLFFLLKNGYPPVSEFTFYEKKTTSEKIFRERIFASEALRKGIESDNKFRRNWFYLKRAALAGLYKYNQFMKEISFIEKEIRQEYIQNRDKKYYKIDRKNNKEKKIYLTYGEAKKIIITRFAREKLKSLKKKWDDNILAANNYKINSKKIN